MSRANENESTTYTPLTDASNSRCTRSLNDALCRVDLDDYAILAQLLLHKNDLLGTLHNKVATWIQWTFCHARKLSLSASGEYAFVAAEHDW